MSLRGSVTDTLPVDRIKAFSIADVPFQRDLVVIHVDDLDIRLLICVLCYTCKYDIL